MMIRRLAYGWRKSKRELRWQGYRYTLRPKVEAAAGSNSLTGS